MAPRWVIAVLAAAGGLALAMTAAAHDQGTGPTGSGTGTSVTSTTVTGPGGGPGSGGAPRKERTHPRVAPSSGTTDTVFRLSFRLRETPGHRGYLATDYQIQVSPHRDAADSCRPTQPSAVTSGHKGQRAHVALHPPPDGWCRGVYRVTIYLQRGPYCPPPQNGQPQACPEFATQDLNTGRIRFTVQ